MKLLKRISVTFFLLSFVWGSHSYAQGFGDFFGGISGGTLGTKFVCCSPESVSCLGGGGGTIYHTMLRDRAITQVDAKARCGVYQMHWGTHSCPEGGGCGGGDVETQTQRTTLMLCNQNTVQPMFGAFSHWHSERFGWSSKGWFRIEPGACTNIDLGDYRGRIFVHGQFAHNGQLYRYGKEVPFCVDPINKFYLAKSDGACNPKQGFNQINVGPGVYRYTFFAVPHLRGVQTRSVRTEVFSEAFAEKSAHEAAYSTVEATEAVEDESHIEERLKPSDEGGDSDWGSEAPGSPDSGFTTVSTDEWRVTRSTTSSDTEWSNPRP